MLDTRFSLVKKRETSGNLSSNLMMKNNTIKVIFFECGSTGGSVHSLMKILKHLDKTKYPAGVFSFSNKSKAAKLLSTSGIEFAESFYTDGPMPPDPIVEKFNCMLPSFFGIKYFLKSLVLLLRNRSACVYINNTPYPHVPLIIAAAFLKRKVICHLRDTIIFTRIEKQMIEYINCYITLSDAAKCHYIQQGVPKDKIKTIYNSIEIQNNDLRVSLIQKKHIRIVVTGSLIYRKGQDICLRALVRVLEHHNNILLTFVGDGEYRNELQKIVSDHCLNENVIFRGHVENVTQICQESDIGVLTSRREGMPNSVMEYMAAGLPVVVTDLPGIRELVDDAVTGFIIGQESDEELAEKLLILIKDADLRAEMGRKGIEKVRSVPFQPATERENILKTILGA